MTDLKIKLINEGKLMRVRTGLKDCLLIAIGLVEEEYSEKGVGKELQDTARVYVEFRRVAERVFSDEELKPFEKRYEEVRRKCFDNHYFKEKK